jgi:hypothetical protein
MKLTYSGLQNEVPIRARVAFVLTVAGRVIPALAKQTEAFSAARKALSDGWKWEEGEKVSARQLYDDNVEELAVQGSLTSDPALGAVISAYYYVVWHAYRQDVTSGHLRQGQIYNDIAEVTEEVIDEVCDYAIRTSLCDTDWIDAIRQRLVSEFRTENPEELGPIVPRQ